MCNRALLKYITSKWGHKFDVVSVQNQGRKGEFKNFLSLLSELEIKFENSFHTNHHLSHAGSIYYTSPFSEALILSFDGSGNDGQTVILHGNGSKIDYVGNYKTKRVLPVHCFHKTYKRNSNC